MLLNFTLLEIRSVQNNAIISLIFRETEEFRIEEGENVAGSKHK
jgi:hypothetical protein